ncbi:hypothetical protein K470DRAFT_282854 [Piedraia hortae CBS 480.64]|uniref:DNA-directed RNA polymerase subunit n=1 Tax=Piedraia hortae CBS 480.64 TaxID=1314780 RepID=A0A6A7BXA8_9PEZI|nr:hypothetical protein K470DRAFT_282854 [Piedraia hortae CBS 480.64]
MFFVKQLEHRVTLHPSFFARCAEEVVLNKLYEDREGQHIGNMLIIAIIDVLEISEPKIMPGSGLAQYDISYRAIVYRPFRGEVVDAVVTNVLHTGFFASAGGLTIFVSKSLIPENLKFTVEGATPCFSDNEDQVVEQNSQVRLRIIGIRSEPSKMYAVGSIREDYLGPFMQ